LEEFAEKIEDEFKQFKHQISPKIKKTFPSSLDLQSIVYKVLLNKRLNDLLVNDGKELFIMKETTQINIT